jgi:23S rRNA (adenine2030-N6)-methyltransferase
VSPIDNYLNLVRKFNHRGSWDVYPGSPAIIKEALRPIDELKLFELHSTDFSLLKEQFSKEQSRVKVFKADGFVRLRGVLPLKRGVIFMDPSYEIRSDYEKVLKSLRHSLIRFSHGTYIVWYPMLPNGEYLRLLDQMRALVGPNILNVSLTVKRPEPSFGLFGSGLFIVNPPWALSQALEPVMPILVKQLAQDDGADFKLEVGSQ